MKKLSVNMTRRQYVLGWVYMVLQLFLIPAALVRINLMFGSPLDGAHLNFLFFCLNFLCIWGIFPRFLIRNMKTGLSAPGKFLLSVAVGLAAYWLLSAFVTGLIVSFYPAFSNVNDSAIGAMASENYTLIALGTVLLVPVTEETLFRGLIFQGLYNRNAAAAYVISSVAFSVPHVISYLGLYDPMLLILCFVQYLPAGFCLGWAYANADSIWAPISIHVLINMIGISAMR